MLWGAPTKLGSIFTIFLESTFLYMLHLMRELPLREGHLFPCGMAFNFCTISLMTHFRYSFRGHLLSHHHLLSLRYLSDASGLSTCIISRKGLINLIDLQSHLFDALALFHIEQFSSSCCLFKLPELFLLLCPLRT